MRCDYNAHTGIESLADDRSTLLDLPCIRPQVIAKIRHAVNAMPLVDFPDLLDGHVGNADSTW